MITAIALIVGSLEPALWIGTKESFYPGQSPGTAGAMLAIVQAARQDLHRNLCNVTDATVTPICASTGR